MRVHYAHAYNVVIRAHCQDHFSSEVLSSLVASMNTSICDTLKLLTNAHVAHVGPTRSANFTRAQVTSELL